MLEELNDSLPAAAVAAAAAAAATPAASSEASGIGGAPSSRGWTMFMEAELQGGGAKPEEGQPEAEPEFYDGPVQTDSGTVVAFAPTAAEPNAGRARPDPGVPDLVAQEPMRSFGARLRGDEAAPTAASLNPVSAPSASAEIPSFAGNKLGNVAVGPIAAVTPTHAPAKRVEAQPDDLDQPESSGSNTKLIVVGLIVVAIIVAIIAIIMAS